jgi:hypothetical protein
MAYDTKPVARKTDPETSHDAAASITDLTEKQEAVLAVLAAEGLLTDKDLISQYPKYGLARQSESGLRTRRAELVRRQLVRDTGLREILPSGRRAIVWSIK